ncbi:MAG: endo-1,4-beta-xylanase, partial [Defluviitaleaceae bacterium]|nr:endo-1,4-beta-xylanase [Defluviitaleaceae bacterium]
MKNKKRFVSLFLVFVMIFSMLPTGFVFAEEKIINNTFEVHFEGWTTDFGSLTTLEARDGEGRNGSRGMKISGRAGAENFAITDKGFYLAGDENYTYSIFVRHDEPQNEKFSMTLQWAFYEENDRTDSTVIAEKIVAPGEWTELSARFATPKKTHNPTIILATDSAADFYFDDFTVTQKKLNFPAAQIFANTPANIGMKDIYANHFRVGNILNGTTVQNTGIQNLIRLEYNSITAENEHKPDATMNRAQSTNTNIVAQFNTGAARINAFCAENNIPIREHALTWHGQTPDWFFFRATGTGAGQFDSTPRSTLRDMPIGNMPWVTQEVMNQRLESYIRNKFALYASQYPNLKIYAVDVVNEYVLVNGNSGQPRRPGLDFEGAGGAGAAPGRSAWTAIYHGTSDNVSAINWNGTIQNTNNWLWRAFHYARQYAPADAKLFYNDYNEFDPTKRNYIINSLLRPLHERGLIDGMGMQGHLDADQGGWSSWARFRDAMDAYADITVPGRGYLEVQITELDISRGHNNGNFSFTEAQQAEKYRQIFNHAITVNARGRGQFTAICIWTINDNHSWIGANQPAIHRGDNTRKPAYNTVAAVVPEAQWGDGKNPEFRFNSSLRNENTGSDFIYDMQTDSQWANILSSTAHNIMRGTGATGATSVSTPSRQLNFPTRTGTSQGLRVRTSALLSALVPANVGVKIEYTGRLSAAGSSQ